jgi:hypothetical protein
VFSVAIRPNYGHRLQTKQIKEFEGNVIAGIVRSRVDQLRAQEVQLLERVCSFFMGSRLMAWSTMAACADISIIL